jgi:hypothetical protein
MPLYKTDGTEMVDADVTAAADENPAPTAKTYTVDQEVIEEYTPQAAVGTATKSKRIKFRAGQKISQKELDEALASSKNA